jgi:hypothetical protein
MNQLPLCPLKSFDRMLICKGMIFKQRYIIYTAEKLS